MLSTLTLDQTPSAIFDGKGQGTRIAVLDSGIHPHWPGNHPERGRFFSLDKHKNIREHAFWDAHDPTGHGSIVDWCIRSVAPNTQTDHIQLLDENNQSQGEALVRALEFSVTQNYDIIHMSLGTQKSNWVIPMVHIMKQCREKGITIVAAGSNIGAFVYPALLTYAISCGALEGRHALHLEYTPQATPEFQANGINVAVPSIAGNTITVSGSSFAAAHLSGIIARLKSSFPSLTQAEIKVLLRNYAQKCFPQEKIA